MVNGKPILSVDCELTEYELSDGSFSYGITIKDQFGKSNHISIKESNKNWRGKITDIYGISLRDIFKNIEIWKYFYCGKDGNTQIILKPNHVKQFIKEVEH